MPKKKVAPKATPKAKTMPFKGKDKSKAETMPFKGKKATAKTLEKKSTAKKATAKPFGKKKK